MRILPVLFHPEVGADIKACRRWYRDIAPELALAFDASLAETVEHIGNRQQIDSCPAPGLGCAAAVLAGLHFAFELVRVGSRASARR